MNFVYPSFLWALFLLLIPIVIHLFSFRKYKTIYFSRVEFLQEVKEDSRTGVRLKHLLILLSRLLFITCLVFAFAQPFIPNGVNQTTENITTIYIDNSLSMQSDGEDGDLLNEIKNASIELVDKFDQNEKIAVLTSELLAEDQRFISKKEAIDRIKSIDFSAITTSLQSAINVSKDLFVRNESPGNKKLIIFSDFQKTIADDIKADSSLLGIYLYHAQATNPGNILIDSVWFESPIHKVNTPTTLNFRARNLTNSDITDLTVNLKIDSESPRPKKISIPANSYIDDEIIYTDRTIGVKKGELSLKSNQLFFDDDFYFNYTIKENISILVITEDEKQNNMNQLYSLSDYYNATTKTIRSVQTEDFENKSFVILQNINQIPSGVQDLLKSVLKNGATISLIPGVNIDLENWNNLLLELRIPTFLPLESGANELTYFASNNPLYVGNFDEEPEGYKFPKLLKHYRFNANSNNEYVTLFGISKSTPYLIYNKIGSGRVIVQASPLNKDFTDFQNHALFGLTYLRLAETSTFTTPLYKSIGDLGNFPINKKFLESNPIHFKNDEYKIDAIPEMITFSNSRFISLNKIQHFVNQAGFYMLSDEKEFNEIIAINFDRRESYTANISKENIQAHFEENGFLDVEILNFKDTGIIALKKLNATEYWRILLILALIFLAIEVLLIKLWKS